MNTQLVKDALRFRDLLLTHKLPFDDEETEQRVLVMTNDLIRKEITNEQD